MIVHDIYGYLRTEIAKAISDSWRKFGIPINWENIALELEEPPIEKFGDISLPTYKFAKTMKTSPIELAKTASENLKLSFIKNVAIVGGYLNIFLNEGKIAEMLFNAIREYGDSFGFLKTGKIEKIIVEHTSANPVHPLHIGTARNAILGDTLARMLMKRGHKVQRRFYINDMGRQVAILAYGYMALGKPKPEGKPDHFFGTIYSITNAIIEIDRLKKEISEARERGEREEYLRLQDELYDWLDALAKLEEKRKDFVEKLAKELSGRNHEKEILEIMRKYERREDEEIVRTVRFICEKVIEGFKETLSKVDIVFDKWDWESDLAWQSIVGNILDKARRSLYATTYKGAFALDLSYVQELREVREKIELPKSFKIPPLILQRSDGTTLYTTRDIAYSIVKFKEADKVINVIMSEQKLEQLQVRLALYALGFVREALNLIHYSYEIVKIPGAKMSGRKGRYVDFDSLIHEAITRAFYEVEKRNPELPKDEKERIAKAVGIGALRYALVSISATKPLVFKWEDVLSFEKNSGPYIQYTYARAKNILKNFGEKVEFSKLNEIDYSIFEEAKTRRLLMTLIKFPWIFAKASDELKPELIVEYAGKLADSFNSFYAKIPVLTEKDYQRKLAKLMLVKASEIVLRNILSLLGIAAPERM